MNILILLCCALFIIGFLSLILKENGKFKNGYIVGGLSFTINALLTIIIFAGI